VIVSWKSFIRIFVPLVFFVSTLGFALSVPSDVYISPDESANALFSELFASEQRLWTTEELNIPLDGIIHPRSIVAIEDKSVPVSFLGLPVLYGTFAAVLGSWVLVFLTPVLALLSVLAWRATVKKLWKDDLLADLSALALMIHPAFWYYSSRGFMHNILFTALLIFAAWFWIVKPLYGSDRNASFDVIASGACIGLALATRGSELIWMGVAIVGLFYVSRKALSFQKIILFAVGLSVALLPFAGLQNAIYGSPLSVGYTVESTEVAVVEDNSQEDASTFDQWVEGSSLGSILLPFGIHERNILNNVLNYGLLLYPWMTLLALAGALLLARNKEYRRYILLTLFVGIWLLIVYGSWSFNDNPDPSAITIGDSHVRYWLPLFVLMTPFVAHLFSYAVKSRHTLQKVSILTIILCILLSGQLVFFGKDGVLAARTNLHEASQKREIILENTDDDGIIVVDYADKYLFPDRRVVIPLRDDSTYAAMPEMVLLTSLYYFGITFPQTDMDYLNGEKLGDMGLRIDPIVTTGEETLYQIRMTDTEF
jgi:hypothetical protein